YAQIGFSTNRQTFNKNIAGGKISDFYVAQIIIQNRWWSLPKKMKNIFLLLLIFISLNNYSQILKERKLNKIESFGINLTNFNQNEKKVINDWNLILDKDWKRKKTKTTGIVFTSLSILSTAFGAKLISDNKDSE
ncbi:MAG: hypothetical protein GZ086_07730, partial [Gelidibacter sp.]|nr:hypothetical protein [Gelidibacter sp.]